MSWDPTQLSVKMRGDDIYPLYERGGVKEVCGQESVVIQRER